MIPAAMDAATPRAWVTRSASDSRAGFEQGRGDGAAHGAADRGGVLSVLEEDRVAGVLVEAGHAEAHADLEADGDGADERRAPVAPARSAAARAAGTTVALGCSTDGRWVSS